MENKKEQLLFEVGQLFMRYGIKSMTMDDIAQNLGISKKTLYKHVSDKKDLVKQVIEQHMAKNQAMLEAIIESKENPIDELIDLNEKVGEQLKNIHPSVMFDLKKYYPEAWAVLSNHRECFVSEKVLNNIKRGMKTGLYRKNMEPEIIVTFYLEMINATLDPDTIPERKYSSEQIHKELVKYHIRGIASKKGVEYLKQKLNNQCIDS